MKVQVRFVALVFAVLLISHRTEPTTTSEQSQTTVANTTNDSLSTNSSNTHTDNQTTRADNLTTASDNQTTRADNLTTASDNQTTRADNLTTASDNQTTRADNLTTASDNQTAPADNLTTATDNQTATMDNQTATMDNQTTATDNQTAAMDNQTAATDNQTTAMDNPTTAPHHEHCLRSSFTFVMCCAGEARIEAKHMDPEGFQVTSHGYPSWYSTDFYKENITQCYFTLNVDWGYYCHLTSVSDTWLLPPGHELIIAPCSSTAARCNSPDETNMMRFDNNKQMNDTLFPDTHLGEQKVYLFTFKHNCRGEGRFQFFIDCAYSADMTIAPATEDALPRSTVAADSMTKNMIIGICVVAALVLLLLVAILLYSIKVNSKLNRLDPNKPKPYEVVADEPVGNIETAEFFDPKEASQVDAKSVTAKPADAQINPAQPALPTDAQTNPTQPAQPEDAQTNPPQPALLVDAQTNTTQAAMPVDGQTNPTQPLQ